ncbi:uncharacterized protein LOC116258085 [Nymphaea colorata]|uniref:Nuclear protein DGCR14 n=1 Tax=Nymphaea colorata TaxID=210225 RepID=A0A5K1EXG8_9MAGN|nr:uncharacterized protein LOC116258085 [Nymphaea colorata]VVW55945.1 unnamed protein product [Nymphaea colorata]
MLATPGRSPRHLSLPESAATPLRSPNPNSVPDASGEQRPLKRRRPSHPIVLDEDTYIAAIEGIIERDFFPDIPKLHDRLDWLSAVRSGDPLQIRDAQLKILERRRASGGGSGSGRHATLTPRSVSVVTPWTHDRTPDQRQESSIEENASNPLAGEGDGAEPAVDSSLSLDAFLRRYTSEDNDSFSKILEKVNRKRRERNRYLTEGETSSGAVAAPENVKRVTDGFGTSGQPTDTLEGWKFTAQNLLMYGSVSRDEAPLTEAELAQRLKAATKEVDAANTRFSGKLADSRLPEEDGQVTILYTPVRGNSPATTWPFSGRGSDKAKKYDLEDLRRTPEDGKGGYSYVRTPSPEPGVEESPFMTWGEIEGTPLRLESEDMTEGPQFKMPDLASRDVKAHNLSREAGRRLREKSRLFGKAGLPLPRGRSASPGLQGLSPAAQKFVKKVMAKAGSGVDETLRASYRASPLPFGTPKTASRSHSRFGRESSLRSPSCP